LFSQPLPIEEFTSLLSKAPWRILQVKDNPVDGTQTRVTRSIDLLLAEDSEDDARLVIRVLQRGGFEVRHQRVESAAAMTAALRQQAWDAVISDYNMPGFSGMAALGILRSTGLDIPFILISGTVGEEIAVDAMKAGADDYVLKMNLSRLAPVLERELKEVATRDERRRAQRDLLESEQRFRNLTKLSSDWFWEQDEEYRFVRFSGGDEDAGWGRDQSNTLGQRRWELSGVVPVSGSWEAHKALLEARKPFRDFEYQRILADGGLQFIAVSGEAFFDASARFSGYRGVATDITERKRAEYELQRFRMAMDVSVDSIYLTDPATMRFVDLNNTACQRLGYTREQLLQLGPQDVLPMDREQISREYGDVIAAGDQGLLHERRFVRSDGSEGWTELRRRALRTEGGMLIVTIGRDVTERKRAEESVRRLNRVYAMLSGINSAIVRIRDRDGLFREVCRIAVEAGEFTAAWVGILDRATMAVAPVAWNGFPDQYIELIRERVRAAHSGGGGVAGQAIREKRPAVANDITQDPRVLINEETLALGSRALVALPFIVGGEVAGVLVLHARKTGFFDIEEMKLLEELAGDIAFALEHLEALERAEYLAFHDPLTGLPNRTVLTDRLGQMLSAARRAKQLAGVMFFDIERFRLINDTLGRQAGDQFLKEVAARFKATIRAQDTVARVGADVFAVAVSSFSHVTEATHLFSDRLTRAFAPPIMVNGRELRAVVKAGVAVFPNDGDTAEALCGNAEAALKKAKETGARYTFYTPELNARVAGMLALENRLRGALEAGQFVLHYQPKVDTKSRALVGLEALIRWNDPESGLVPPAKFIPLMEETGIILHAGRWALGRAIADVQAWRAKGFVAPRVAVNVSPMQLRQRDFVQSVLETLEGFGDAEPVLDLEITESMMMQNLEATILALQTLRGVGVETSLDDFGTGYSSLAYVARLPVVALKIDRSFVVEMTFSRYARTIVQTVISLAHSLGLKVIAEGVDAEEQAALLAEFGCDQMQGYLISKPVPPAQIEAMLQKA
jgi:diguanylate cyclase (GGDEF)-like protein/PAS domain S-box-containing protein